jgi:membrane fusion protein (multidrug efflux system)
VSAGAALVALDTRQERAQLASAQAQAELAGTNLKRAKTLLDRQLIAQAEYDPLAATYKQAEAAVNEIRATIDRKTIRAPFSGVTGIRQVNLGQYVHSGDPIVPLQAVEPVFVDFSVPQQQVAQLRVGAVVHAAADSGARAEATGRISTINPIVDEATRNVLVQSTFHGVGGRLRPGAYVTVRVLLGQPAPVLALPSSAINFAPYGNSIFVVEKMKNPKGQSYTGVRQQFVALGPARGDQVAILSGLKPGEQVVTSGVFKLRPGAAVTVNNRVQPSNSPTPKPEDS